MPYYGARGDYYRGDYYRGDPFLGAILGAVGGKVVKKVGSWVGSRIGRAAGSAPVRTVMDQLPGVGVGMGIEAVRNRFSPTVGPIPTLGPINAPSGGPSWGAPKKRYRKMNPLNPRALKRAIRRAEGFEKFARKTVSGLRYGPKKFKSAKRS